MTCAICGGSGWALAYRSDAPLTEFAFICDACPAAKKRRITKSRQARSWGDDLMFEGWVLRSMEREAEDAWRESVNAYYATGKVRRHG